MPFGSRKSLMAISSPIIVLPLVTVRAPEPAADLEDRLRASSASAAPMHLAAILDDLALEALEIEVEIGQRMVLDLARLVAQRLELGQAGGRVGALR
jgi:hypothetical protein